MICAFSGGSPPRRDSRSERGNPSVSGVDAKKQVTGVRGIGERSEQVEDRTLAQFAARADGVLHGRMEAGCEHEADANFLDALGHRLRFQVHLHAQFTEHVGASAAR
ncbi:MAG: hypothetical protein P8Z41_09730 [Anaerolineales bacterium]